MIDNEAKLTRQLRLVRVLISLGDKRTLVSPWYHVNNT